MDTVAKCALDLNYNVKYIVVKNFKSFGSPRELLNIFQASEIGCHIITVTPDIINKMKLISYDLNKYSHDTVKMFYDDAVSAGYKI